MNLLLPSSDPSTTTMTSLVTYDCRLNYCRSIVLTIRYGHRRYFTTCMIMFSARGVDRWELSRPQEVEEGWWDVRRRVHPHGGVQGVLNSRFSYVVLVVHARFRRAYAAAQPWVLVDSHCIPTSSDGRIGAWCDNTNVFCVHTYTTQSFTLCLY